MQQISNLAPPGNPNSPPKPTLKRLRRCKTSTKAVGVFILALGENDRTIALIGRLAETLAALVLSGSRGLTERGADWAWHLPEYIAKLRSKGVSISTTMEPHPGGFHARYRLETPTIVMSYQPAQYGR